jgi:hypothetical protein
MDAMSLLEEARAAGLILIIEEGRLRIRGPRRAETVAQRLISHREEVLNLLNVKPAPIIGPDDLPGDWRVDWEERAAIMEHDGKLPRERAEALALTEIVKAMSRPAPSKDL